MCNLNPKALRLFVRAVNEQPRNPYFAQTLASFNLFKAQRRFDRKIGTRLLMRNARDIQSGTDADTARCFAQLVIDAWQNGRL